MRFARLSVLVFLILVTAMAAPTSVDAQAPVTAAVAVAGANAVLGKLQNVLTTVTGNAQIAVNATISQISVLSGDVTRDAGVRIGDPIASLGRNVQMSVERLANVTATVDAIISRQQACLFQNLDLMVAGLSTAVAQAKHIGPLLKEDPRLVSFTFAGLVTPNVVPRAGGAAQVKGYRLWERLEYPPDVTLQLLNGTVLAKIIPRRGLTVGDIVAPIDASLIKAHAGECLQLAVTAYSKKKIALIPAGRRIIGAMSMPMCVPQDFDRSLAITANISYSVTTQVERTLSAKRFGWANRNCSDRSNVSQTQLWDAEIPQGFRIVRVQEGDLDVENQTSIGISFTATGVTAAGWLDRATCIRTPISATFLHDSHWYRTLTPVMVGPSTVSQVATLSGPQTPMGIPTTTACANVPVDVNKSGASTVWYTLSSFVGGQLQPQPLFVSARQTTTDATFSRDDNVAGYTIHTAYNPNVVAGTCEVCATVKSTQGCAW